MLAQTLSFANPAAVELLQWIGVSGLGHPISSRMRQIVLLSLVLTKTKRAPSSASAAEVATNLRRDERTWIGPLEFIGCLLWGSYPRKKCPAAQIFALGVPRCEA